MLAEPAKFEGSYFAGGLSNRQAACLNISQAGQVSVIFEDTKMAAITVVDFNDLEISPRLGNTPRYINFTDGSCFETSNNDKIDAVLATYSKHSSYRFIHFLESQSFLVLLIAVVVGGFIWSSVKVGVPAMADLTAELLPVEVSQYLGQGSLQLLDETIFSPSKIPQNRQNELSQRLKLYSSTYPELNIAVKFRQAKEIGANAMALPDGNIIFTDELIELAENDLELVAIFAHEIGHLAHRHMLRRVIQDSMLTLIVVLITGDISSASSVVYVIPGLLLELSYSREFEGEADDFAHDFLLLHKIDTQHFANIMLRLMDEKNMTDTVNELSTTDNNKPQGSDSSGRGISPYFSTHPATRERIRKFITSKESTN